jgi:cytochrome c oxidase cbb3-type subunit III
MSATTDASLITTTEVVDAPVDPDADRLMDHSYDGIQEYDNPLPGWWRAIFWGSIVFAAGYIVWFHVGKWGQTPDAAYRAALADYDGKKTRRDAADAANVSEEMIARGAQDAKVLEHGAAIFATRCVSCHTADGHGLIGPNLTDLYQIHGSTRMDIYTTVRGGVPGTAMLAWGEQMPATDVLAVATFATTLRGKNIPGKEKQGHPVEAFK